MLFQKKSLIDIALSYVCAYSFPTGTLVISLVEASHIFLQLFFDGNWVNAIELDLPSGDTTITPLSLNPGAQVRVVDELGNISNVVETYLLPGCPETVNFELLNVEVFCQDGQQKISFEFSYTNAIGSGDEQTQLRFLIDGVEIGQGGVSAENDTETIVRDFDLPVGTEFIAELLIEVTGQSLFSDTLTAPDCEE